MRRITLFTAAVMTLSIIGGVVPASATFPGRNGLITFSRGGAVSEIDGIRLHGTSRKVIVDGLKMPGLHPAAPQWSHDGAKLAFIASDSSTNTGEIYKARKDGSHIKRLTHNTTSDTYPNWSPDGTRIYYQHRYHLWVMLKDGTAPHKVTGLWINEPALSPQGRTIAFQCASKRPHDLQICTMRSDGSHVRRLTDTNRLNMEPSWSPDGRHIVFIRGTEGTLAVMRKDGSHEREIALRIGASTPVYSPNGRWIAFYRFGYADLGAVRRGGKGFFVLPKTDNAGEGISWQRR